MSVPLPLDQNPFWKGLGLGSFLQHSCPVWGQAGQRFGGHILVLFHTHFRHKQTEVQRSQVTCLTSQGTQVAKLVVVCWSIWNHQLSKQKKSLSLWCLPISMGVDTPMEFQNTSMHHWTWRWEEICTTGLESRYEAASVITGQSWNSNLGLFEADQ